jgi:hypothetical protein
MRIEAEFDMRRDDVVRVSGGCLSHDDMHRLADKCRTFCRRDNPPHGYVRHFALPVDGRVGRVAAHAFHLNRTPSLAMMQLFEVRVTFVAPFVAWPRPRPLLQALVADAWAAEPAPAMPALNAPKLQAMVAGAMPPLDAPKPEPAKGTSRWRDGLHFITSLERRGFRLIGSGAFSWVMAKPGSDKVVKVCRNLDAWPEYVTWATRCGFAGKYAPRVYSFHMVDGRDDQFYVAVVERLDATVSTLAWEPNGRAISQLRTDIALFIQGDDAKGAVLASTRPELVAFALAFRVFYRRTMSARSIGLDLHGGNWMLKGDRIVLTDPVCDGTPTTPKRLRSRDLQPALAA